VRLTPPVGMSPEQAIAYIADDELVEVTPKSIRLRKRLLDPNAQAHRPRRRGGIAARGKFPRLPPSRTLRTPTREAELGGKRPIQAVRNSRNFATNPDQ